MKSGNMNGNNGNSVWDRLDLILSKVSQVGDSLQVLHDWMLFKTNSGKIHQRLNLLTTLVASDFTAILSESDINNFFNEKLLYNNYLLWLELMFNFLWKFQVWNFSITHTLAYLNYFISFSKVLSDQDFFYLLKLSFGSNLKWIWV